MIKNLVFLIFLVITLCSSLFISFKNFVSLNEQTHLLFDFNSGDRKLNWDFVKDFNQDFPSIAATTLPIKTTKAYYLFKEERYEEAIELIKSDESNKYLGIKENYLADIYEKLDNPDSLFYYREKAFNLLPNNTRHHTTYFNLLAKKSDSLTLERSFKRINSKQLITYKNYIYNMGRVKKEKNQLIEMVDSLILAYPKDSQLKEIKIQTLIGIEKYTKSEIIETIADELFNNSDFEKSISKYKEAIKINPYMYQFYESVGVNYLKIQMLDSAKHYFRKAIKKREIEDGKSEFYIGAIILNENKTDSACVYFRKSNRMGYKNSINLINTYCKKSKETQPKSNKINSLK